MPDIDIDLPDRNKILSIIEHVPALLSNGRRHNTGVYCQKIPVNPLTNTASLDYETAENRGYFKMDFLNVNIYKDIKNEQHLLRLINKEPLWDLLLQNEFVDLLFQLSGHTNILKQTRPDSLDKLAAVLAMIRPAKKHLIGKDWSQILNEVWIKPTDNNYYWKKSHAYSYAMAVILHMNLLCEQLNESF